MAEIDFEELDKAVSSLMDQQNNLKSAVTAAEEPAAINNEPSPISDALSSSSPVAQSPSPARTQVPASPAIKRQTGRFMDVVHPSSDMRMNSMKSAPSARPSREAAPLQPVEPQPEASFAEPASESIASQASEAPDFDMQLENSLIETPGPHDSGASSSPVQSPFLDDVEVDKRPLGSAPVVASEEVSSEPSLEPENDIMPDPIGDWSEPVEPAATEGALSSSPAIDLDVAEASSNESLDPWPADRSAAQDKDSKPAATPVPPELSPEIMALESDNAPSPADNSATEAQPSAPGDIPRQYASAPADAPEPSAVFEAASDPPKDLQHPEKKKSGWLIVVWILLLLVVGAGGGVAAWYFLLK